jgi:hypothetical protein
VGRGKPSLIIPLNVPGTPGYLPPTREVRQLLSSYARHVASTPHPDDPGLTLAHVKIYKVTHDVASVAFIRGVDILDPRFYRCIFLGDYDAKGVFLDQKDPFLYWGLPNVWDERGFVKSYVLKHARDPKWIYLPDEPDVKSRWVDEKKLRLEVPVE